MYRCVCVCVRVGVCMCVCERERKRQREMGVSIDFGRIFMHFWLLYSGTDSFGVEPRDP